MANRAGFPPGDAREDWAILRALSDVLGHEAAFRLAARSCAPALFKAHPHLARHRPDRGRRRRRHRASWRRCGGDARQGAVPLGRSTTSISPTRSRAPPRSWPNARRSPQAAPPDGGGVGTMAELLDRLSLAADRDRGAVACCCSSCCWSSIAYVLLRRPQDLGGGADAARPERGRPVGPAAVLRRPAEVRVQGADHPGRRQQGRVPAGAAGHLRAGARRLGGDPGRSPAG